MSLDLQFSWSCFDLNQAFVSKWDGQDYQFFESNSFLKTVLQEVCINLNLQLIEFDC